MKGTFITFEGPEGSGKTTVARMVLESLNEEGYEVLYTREPGGIDIAEQIRKVILDPKNTAMDAKTEALLYAASRRQHLIEKVLPALEKGTVVICDRFVDSSLVYQGVAPEIGLQRIAENAHREVNRLDLETIDFHHHVYEGYQEVLRRYPERITRVDAGAALHDVYQTVLAEVRKYL